MHDELDKDPLVKVRRNHIWIGSEITEELAIEFHQKLLDVAQYAGYLEESYTPVTVHILSPGGDAFAGLAIYDLLKGYSGEVTTIIEGFAASAGSLIAMAGAPKNRFIRPSGFMLIHDVSGSFYGKSKEVKDFAKIMSMIRARMHSIYRVASGRTSEQIDELLDKESWLGAEEAVTKNFVELLTRL